MIGKVMIGKSFSGCVRYVVQKPEAVLLDAEGIRTETASAMVADFNLQRQLRPELEKAVGHIALSWSTQDAAKLTPAIMAARAKEYMEKMQIKDTQYLIVQHWDKQHPHLHIVYNRVDYESKTISDKFQHRRNAKVCRELTQKHGYYLAPGKGQVNRQRLKGADKVKYELHDAVKEALGRARSWQELERLLTAKSIRIDYKCRRGTDEVQGVSFHMGELSFKGSAVDRSLSYGNITRRLEQNRQQSQQVAPAPRPRQPSYVRPQAPALVPSSGESSALHSLSGTLLSPEAAQAEGMQHLNDYTFKRTKRKKRKGRHL
ncbi:relaxase/mobilization nuclease domain-containing protein [Pontibacter mangrovi]|uniref:Mobilization protein n=1 Tax=Pontibacter mangrovi TaxID=2589816 RepID=A0A501WCW8_9BACT|nr:relaxase/mobilization nuclease domain-containing protein [Pontibacter mangrovi]TPE43326.1 mobilization protein [Pontibacter mangrovi]